jgi:uncharacterized protein (TIGR02996 family)
VTAALEAAILEDPDDDAPYLVYGDWLAAQGDPRGELIGLHHRKRKTAAAFLKTHAARFLGPLAGRTFKGTWRLGFLHSATVTWSADTIARLLESPSARFLRELTVKVTTQPMHQAGFDHLVEQLVATPRRPPLAVLRVQ